MKKISILIVDDESLARTRITSFLSARNEDFSCQEAANGIAALELLTKQAFDILFLDIQMPALSGMELLAHLERRDFQVIFATAYDEYAVKAFEENACDYLLKPFSKERFNAALDRALQNIGTKSSLQKIESELQKRDGYLDKICARVGNKTVLIPTLDIIAFVSQDHYTNIFSKDKEYLIELSLNHLEERLDPSLFQRFHRNNIVAVKQISAVISGENMQIELTNGLKLPVSRNNRKKLQ